MIILRITMKELWCEFSALTGAEPQFNGAAGITKDKLVDILEQLRDYDPAKTPEIKDERPQRPRKNVSELHTGYRRKLSEHIERNTGIQLPVLSTISSRFYDLVADYAGL